MQNILKSQISDPTYDAAMRAERLLEILMEL